MPFNVNKHYEILFAKEHIEDIELASFEIYAILKGWTFLGQGVQPFYDYRFDGEYPNRKEDEEVPFMQVPSKKYLDVRRYLAEIIIEFERVEYRSDIEIIHDIKKLNTHMFITKSFAYWNSMDAKERKDSGYYFYNHVLPVFINQIITLGYDRYKSNEDIANALDRFGYENVLSVLNK